MVHTLLPCVAWLTERLTRSRSVNRERSGTSEAEIDIYFGWNERVLLKRQGHADALQWLEYAPEDEDVQDHGHALGEWRWGMICHGGWVVNPS